MLKLDILLTLTLLLDLTSTVSRSDVKIMKWDKTICLSLLLLNILAYLLVTYKFVQVYSRAYSIPVVCVYSRA